MNAEAIIVGALITVLWQLIGHWFHWELFTGGQLGRLASYTYGCLGILAGLCVWAIFTHESISPWSAVGVVFIIVVAAGLAVAGAYGLDRLGEKVHYERTRTTMDKAVTKEE